MEKLIRYLLPVLILALFAVAASKAHAQELVYVDDDASGADDGSSWNNAYPNLQDALAAAADDDVIAVAQGTYYPDEGMGIPTDDRDTSFVITGAQNGLKVYGGYAGDESISLDNLMLGARDFEANETILSGDVDDTPDDASGNSFNVIFLDGVTGANITSDTRIDGVTVTDGNAAGSAGGGLYCDGAFDGNECSPTLANMTFRDNFAGSGGALYNSASQDGVSSPTITASTFTGNSADGGGGAIYNGGIAGGVSSPVISNTTFDQNNTNGCGGAIYNRGTTGGVSSPAISNSSFVANGADAFSGSGGAICEDSGNGLTSPTITASTFEENTASSRGGAILSDGTLLVTGTSFTGNAAGGSGGAIFGNNNNNGGLTIINSTFGGNTAAIDGEGGLGGAILIESDGNVIINAAFSGNTASSSGGAVFIADGKNPTITNATFADNSAFESGGAIYNSEGSSPTITNSIFFDNSGSGNGDQIFNAGEASEPTVSYSLVEGGCSSIPGTICNAGNITGDPQFADAEGEDDTVGTADDDLRLQGPGSADGPSLAIDAGDNSAVSDTITTDATGEMDRLFDVTDVEDTGNGSAPIVDMGVYESDGSPLPVELASFTGRADGRSAVLEWKTLSETNSQGFYVERRAGASWETVGEMIEGAGTSQEAHRYSHRVEDLDLGRHVFRLRQVDRDGAEKVFDDQRVELEVRMEKAYILEGAYPNPFQNRATIEFAVQETQEVTVELYNALGQRVKVLKEGEVPSGETVTMRLEAGSLSSGVYFVRLRGEDFATAKSVTLVR